MSDFPISKFVYLSHRAPSRYSSGNKMEVLGHSFFDNTFIELFEDFKEQLFAPMAELGGVSPLSYYFFHSNDYLHHSLIKDYLIDSILPVSSFDFLDEFESLRLQKDYRSKNLDSSMIEFIVEHTPVENLKKWDAVDAAPTSGLIQKLIKLESQGILKSELVSDCVKLLTAKKTQLFSNFNGYEFNICSREILELMLGNENTNIMSKDINGYSLYDFIVEKKDDKLLDLMNQKHQHSLSGDTHEANIFFNEIVKLGKKAASAPRGYKNRPLRDQLFNLVTNREDAFQLLNSDGENVLMVLAHAHMEVFWELEEFCKKKKTEQSIREGFNSLLKKTDSRGRGLGFYIATSESLDENYNPFSIREYYNACSDNDGDQLLHQALKQEMEKPENLKKYNFRYGQLTSFSEIGENSQKRISAMVENYFVTLLDMALNDGKSNMKALASLIEQKKKFLFSSNSSIQESMENNFENIACMRLILDMCELRFGSQLAFRSEDYYKSNTVNQLAYRIESAEFTGDIEKGLNQLVKNEKFKSAADALTISIKTPDLNMPSNYQKILDEKVNFLDDLLFSVTLKNTIKKSTVDNSISAPTITRF